jgi:hypothetical protein
MNKGLGNHPGLSRLHGWRFRCPGFAGSSVELTRFNSNCGEYGLKRFFDGFGGIGIGIGIPCSWD